MNPQIIIGLICLAIFAFSFLMAWVMFFRLSCRICNLEPPGILATLGIVVLTFAVGLIVEGMLAAFVRMVYTRSNLPIWESGITTFFLGLPIDMLLNAGIHAALMKIPMGKGIEVWFVQRILLTLVFGVIGVLVAMIYFSRGK